MSLEIEDQSVLHKAYEAFDGSQKRSTISYAREFLLSLGELEICKKLPRGFDRTLLGLPKISYTREFLLSLGELEMHKKSPRGFDRSLLGRSKISYTREFLLSLGELEICKKLPRGFDRSLLGRPKISYTREFLLSSGELEICKKLPRGLDRSLLGQSKISYTREFLLPLRELEICKKLPRGFDRSLLGDFENASHDLQERSRISGGFQSQGFRRTEYGSSPPARGDSSNYSRGIYGRWDSRSSGTSDKDSDSQSDWDTGMAEINYPNISCSCGAGNMLLKQSQTTKNSRWRLKQKHENSFILADSPTSQSSLLNDEVEPKDKKNKKTKGVYAYRRQQEYVDALMKLVFWVRVIAIVQVIKLVLAWFKGL